MKTPFAFQHYLDLGAPAHLELLHANTTGQNSGIHLIEDDDYSGFTPLGTVPKQLALEIVKAYEINETPAYVGQQAFRLHDRRCIDNVTFLNAAYVDLDTYNTEYKDCSFLDVWEAIQAQFPTLPVPTIAGSSGRGLQLVWCFKEGKPKSFLPQWQQIEDTLVKALSQYGADPKAKDASRVLRISHSYNKKSGSRAALKQTGKPVTYEALQRWGNAYRKVHQEPSPRKTSPNKNAGKRKSSVTKLTTKNAYTLHHCRMEDYRTLAVSRGGRFTDHRRRVIYLFACSAAWFTNDEEALINEVEWFVEKYVCDPVSYTRLNIKEIIERQAEAKQGKKRKYGGMEVDPRYRHRNKTIIGELDITEAEQSQLLTIIGSKENKARDRLRKADKRRKAGIDLRVDYLAKVASEKQRKRQMALVLASQGLTKTKIASQIGVSRQSVFEYLKQSVKL